MIKIEDYIVEAEGKKFLNKEARDLLNDLIIAKRTRSSKRSLSQELVKIREEKGYIASKSHMSNIITGVSPISGRTEKIIVLLIEKAREIEKKTT